MVEKRDSRFFDYCKSVGHKHPERIAPYIEGLIQVFAKTDVVSKSVVIDLCPGFSPKVVFALDGLEYAGQLVTVDVDQQALIHQQQVAKQLNVQFTVAGLVHDVFDPSCFEQPAVLVGNHIVDDLLADQFSKRRGVDYWGTVFEDPGKQVEFWNGIGKDTEFLDEMRGNITQTLARLPNNSLIVLNNYRSNFDTINGITNRPEICDSFIDLLEGGLPNVGYQTIDLNVSPGRWVIARKN